ncbi:unnamed protein product [Moneuplotes crassus]|uniref:Uncharacterized protein n=1 Tax=Euplotes crassus TaxID=5936 RepID=A0AAD2DBQ5_EUPCR|nr:unnamed protein product [Moneuplotes crassus]
MTAEELSFWSRAPQRVFGRKTCLCAGSEQMLGLKKRRCSGFLNLEISWRCCMLYNLIKIDNFRELHKLDKLWSKLLPDLREYKQTHAQLKNDLGSAKATNGWDRLPYLLIEARTLLGTLLKSLLWKEYCKEESIRQFRDSQYGATRMYSASKKWINGQIMKLKDHLTVTRYGELKEEYKQLKQEYKQKSELCNEKQKKIDQKLRKIQSQEFEILELKYKIQENRSIQNRGSPVKSLNTASRAADELDKDHI